MTPPPPSPQTPHDLCSHSKYWHELPSMCHECKGLRAAERMGRIAGLMESADEAMKRAKNIADSNGIAVLINAYESFSMAMRIVARNLQAEAVSETEEK